MACSASFAALWWWSRRRGLHLMDTMEFVAPIVPPGLGFGRLGNYISGELWGKPPMPAGASSSRALPQPFAAMDATALRAQFERAP